HSTVVYRRGRRPFRYRRDNRRTGSAEKGGARIQGLLSVPQREITLFLGQSRQAVLPLLRLWGAWHRDRLSHAIREDGVLRRRGRPRAARSPRNAARGT